MGGFLPPSRMGSQTQPQWQFVTGENATPRIPLTASCRARPLEDTGSKQAHKAALQGGLLHLQMTRQLCPPCSTWGGRALLVPGCDTSLPSGKKQIWGRGQQPDQSASLCCLERSRRLLGGSLTQALESESSRFKSYAASVQVPL